MSQIVQGKETVLAGELAAKANSKYEIYVLLSIEAKICLPKNQHVTIYFLRDIISGKKKGKS